MKTKIIFYLFLTGLIGTACGQNQNINIRSISAEQFKTELQNDDRQLIDIRTPEEYAQGHIEGARLINFYSDTFKEEMAKLDTLQPVYIYCRSGNRSGKASRMLGNVGFDEVVNLGNGIIDWQRSGYELVK